MIKLRLSSPHSICPFILTYFPVRLSRVKGGPFFILVYTESAPMTLDIHQALKAGFH